MEPDEFPLPVSYVIRKPERFQSLGDALFGEGLKLTFE